MAPGFFSKLVRPSSNHSRSSSTPSSPQSPSTRHPSISSSSSAKHSLENKQSGTATVSSRSQLASVGYESSDSGPNVTVIPPSPSASGSNITLPVPPSAPPARELVPEEAADSARRRIQSLPAASIKSVTPPTAMPLPSFSDDGLATPTLATTSFSPTPSPSSQISQSIESMPDKLQAASSLSSKGSVRSNHPRSATTSEGTHLQTPKELRHASSSKSLRSKLSIMLPSRDTTPQASQASRSASAQHPLPPVSSSTHPEDTTLVESPTGLTLSHDIPSIARTLPTSTTAPLFRQNLLVPDNSDAASISSVGSATSKKHKLWRRRSNSSTIEPVFLPTTLVSASSSNSKTKPPPRKSTNTSLASALASSGLAMANPGFSIPPIPAPAETNSAAARGRTSYEKPRSRGASVNYGASEFSDRDSYHSGQEGSDFESSDDSDELDLDAEDIPVTGFAVASNKRNQDFHELFPTVDEGDYLIEDYGCALQREILIQGRLYISENHVCFHANIFGWITDLSIQTSDVISLEKRMTAFVIPNAIQLSTRTAKFTFTSFLARDTTYDVLFNVLRTARPEPSVGSRLVSPRGSLDNADGESVAAATDGGVVNGAAPAKEAAAKSKFTQCDCGRAGGHYPEVAMDAIFPGTPEKIYNLMFTSGFIKDFMRENQKLLDIQISDWTPTDNPQLLARNMTYIKPLNASIGPKQARCELRDETMHCDFDDFVTMITTTRTPDVPSGGAFSVKTRTCITWATSMSSKVLVTSQVEWTGRSFIKGIIERSCIDGQKTYHVDLEQAMREYIHAHGAEFIPEGMDVAAVEESAAQAAGEAQGQGQAQTPTSPSRTPSSDAAAKWREQERNQRSLQWAYETLEGTMKVARQSTEGALELIRDAWDQSSSTTILYFAIVFLVLSNLWTLFLMGGREEVGRRKEMRKMEEREKWVQGIVTALWEEMLTTRGAAAGAGGVGGGVLNSPLSRPVGGDWKDEVGAITAQLDLMEQRIQNIRDGLKELD